MSNLQKNWKDLIKPYKLEVKRAENNNFSAKIIIEPLERGYGVTIGNALRRTMLSSIRGSAIVGLKISGVAHEFSSIPGVLEDVTSIVGNLKNVSVRKDVDADKKINVSFTGPIVITAGLLFNDSQVEVLNPEAYICSLDEGASIEMTLLVSSGKGYHFNDDQENSSDGFIRMDAMFSPVRSVAYHVENTRVGQNTDYDRLILEVVTNGSVSPEESVSIASKILRTQFDQFISFDESVDEVPPSQNEVDVPFNQSLLLKIDELEFSVRAMNCLKNDNIVYIGDLVQRTESDMLKTPNFGRKSLNEIKEVLQKLNLTLGMTVPGWPPESVEDLSNKISNK